MNAYRTLLERPGALALVGAGLLARSPIATYPIGLLMLLGPGRGSYTLAGAAVGVYSVAAVIAGPAAGRRYDRLGPARVLPFAAVLQLGLLLAVVAARPVPLVLAAAGALGLVVPQAGVLVRARWATLLPDPAELRRALFLEGALDEATFVVGPLLVTTVGRFAGPGAALVAAGTLATAGSLWLARQPGTARPPAQPTGGASWRGRPFVALCAAFAAVGAVFGCVQVGVLAVAAERASAWAAGPVLAAFSAISLTAGLVGGARHRTDAPSRRYRQILLLLAVGMVLPAAVPAGPVGLALSLVLAAGAASPAVANGYSLAERHVPAPNLVEGLGSVTAGLNLGLSAGTALAGALADAAGGRAVFLAGAVLALLGWAAATQQVPAPARR